MIQAMKVEGSTTTTGRDQVPFELPFGIGINLNPFKPSTTAPFVPGPNPVPGDFP